MTVIKTRVCPILLRRQTEASEAHPTEGKQQRAANLLPEGQGESRLRGEARSNAEEVDNSEQNILIRDHSD